MHGSSDERDCSPDLDIKTRAVFAYGRWSHGLIREQSSSSMTGAISCPSSGICLGWVRSLMLKPAFNASVQSIICPRNVNSSTLPLRTLLLLISFFVSTRSLVDQPLDQQSAVNEAVGDFVAVLDIALQLVLGDDA